jgi:hypothetical protein
MTKVQEMKQSQGMQEILDWANNAIGCPDHKELCETVERHPALESVRGSLSSKEFYTLVGFIAGEAQQYMGARDRGPDEPELDGCGLEEYDLHERSLDECVEVCIWTFVNANCKEEYRELIDSTYNVTGSVSCLFNCPAEFLDPDQVPQAEPGSYCARISS